jgi:DNA-binding NtrC family response regulator
MNTTVPYTALSILIVEDDKISGPMLQEILEKCAGEISILKLVEKLDLAKTLTKLIQFDFVLSDNHLPDGMGIDFLNELCKSSPGTFRCLMSGDFNPTAAEGAKHNFLRKPAPVSELLDVVRKAREHKATWSAKHPRKTRH